jgi:hypothetical protein
MKVPCLHTIGQETGILPASMPLGSALAS